MTVVRLSVNNVIILLLTANQKLFKPENYATDVEEISTRILFVFFKRSDI